MAAGMGSRYGGLKQMDGVGPGNEPILDYSIFDAKKAGFNKIVFVIREEFAPEFKKLFNQKRYNGMEVHYVYQDINAQTNNYPINPNRTKPWGTNHAVMMGKDVINEPFFVINADDFYGYETFEAASKQLGRMQKSKNKYAMVGYKLTNTLSENGKVSRGICKKQRNDVVPNSCPIDYLKNVEEHSEVGYEGEKIYGTNASGEKVELRPNTFTSVNAMIFTPDYFTHSNYYFDKFLKSYGKELTKEFYLPKVVDNLIKEKKVTMRILPVTSKWMGITYKPDKKLVSTAIAQMIEEGKYPNPLW
jgi:hypothetical protein